MTFLTATDENFRFVPFFSALPELEADDLFNHLKLKSQQDKMDKKAREKIISSFRGNYATCYVNQSTKV